jgi:hypothetical protein
MGDQQEVSPVALSSRKIRLHEGVRHDRFERFVLEELFPSVDTSGDGSAPDQHYHYQKDWPSDVYVWMTRLEYSVHQTVRGRANEVGALRCIYGRYAGSCFRRGQYGWSIFLASDTG